MDEPVAKVVQTGEPSASARGQLTARCLAEARRAKADDRVAASCGNHPVLSSFFTYSLYVRGEERAGRQTDADDLSRTPARLIAPRERLDPPPVSTRQRVRWRHLQRGTHGAMLQATLPQWKSISRTCCSTWTHRLRCARNGQALGDALHTCREDLARCLLTAALAVEGHRLYRQGS